MIGTAAHSAQRHRPGVPARARSARGYPVVGTGNPVASSLSRPARGARRAPVAPDRGRDRPRRRSRTPRRRTRLGDVRDRDERLAGLADRGCQPAPTDGEDRRARRRALGRAGQRHRHAEDVRDDLAPQRAAGPAAGRAQVAERLRRGRPDELERVTQAERDALEDRADEVPETMADREADERAARQRVGVGVRSPLR